MQFGPKYRHFSHPKSLYRDSDAIIEDADAMENYSEHTAPKQLQEPVTLRLLLSAGLNFGEKKDYHLLFNNGKHFAKRIYDFNYAEARKAFA